MGQTLSRKEVSCSSIMLQGASNFRSLEGIGTRDGRKVRRNVLFRSDELSRLTSSDWNLLEQMNLKAICDLRRPDEREGYETKVPNEMDVELHSWEYDVELTAQMLAMRDVIKKAMEPLKTASDAELHQWIQSQYTRYGAGFDGIASHIRSIIDVILKHQGNGAVLIHCAAGKDRTGFATAAILSAIGVDREVILDDYMITTRNYETNPTPREHLQPLLKRHGLDDLPEHVIQIMCVAYRGAMESALDYLNTTHGSVEQFLKNKVNLSDEEFQQLTSILT